MSDHVVQTVYDTDTETKDPMHPHQYAHMSEWMRHGSSNLATLEHDHIALGDVRKGDDWDHKQVLTLAPIAEHGKAQTLRGYTGDLPLQKTDVPESIKGIGNIARTRIVTYTNETLVMNSKNLTNVRSKLLHPFGGTRDQFVMPQKKETQPSSSYVQSKEYFAKASCAHMECDYRGQSQISQTTHHMLITKNFGVNICEEDQMMRKSTVCAESRGNAWPEHLGLLPDVDYDVEHKIVLSSKENQGNEDARDQANSLGTNNESSADTDIMDTKVFQTRNNFLGVDSSPSDKDGQNVPAKYQLVSPSREVGRRKREFELPDMNEMPPCPASESAMENMSFSTSRTESLDMECLHSQLVHVENLTSNPQQKTPQDLDPRCRWVKRIKNSQSEEVSYTKNISTLLNKNMDYNRTTTELTSSKHIGKKQMELGKNMMLSRSREPSSMVSKKEQRDPTLSHFWIQRWCHNVAGASTIKPLGEPQRSNAAWDALERRQLPSIAAMALMGKAMSGFQTCEFKNKGSFVVWSSGEV